MIRPAAALLIGLLGSAHAASGLAAAESADAATKPALTIERGSVGVREVIALGRDLVVEGEARSHVAAIRGSVRVDGKVAGDLVVLDGDARLGPNAQVLGDAFVLGGRLEVAPGAVIGGRSAAYAEASAAWLALLEGPTLGLAPFAPVVLATKLALLGAWGLALLGACAFRAPQLRSTARAIRDQPFRSFFLGLTGVLALALTAVLVSAVAAWLVGLPLLVILVATALAFKVWGMVAVFAAFGGWLCERVERRRVGVLHAAGAGLLALGVVKFLPWLGAIGWTLATLIGVGATLATKFGRDEPWLDGVNELSEIEIAS